jgi:hypothetical protein
MPPLGPQGVVRPLPRALGPQGVDLALGVAEPPPVALGVASATPNRSIGVADTTPRAQGVVRPPPRVKLN